MRAGSAFVVPGSAAARRLRTTAAVALLLAGGLACAAPVTAVGDPGPQRRRELVHMVRQDCGACHGMRLTGGLGPALTPSALNAWTAEGLAATILHGRPGTPMPPWRSFMSEAEADWIARQLLRGFPQEAAEQP